ncbi:unnamed protein product [Dovyalis caffra]|uniref:Uncharacterized protein n=1 Tax=Dovyalis caffra TaxID=77055 RepID=A0AAV1RCH6_9ROSI|nr:unnamed protein product [Dovyalis caffra]
MMSQRAGRMVGGWLGEQHVGPNRAGKNKTVKPESPRFGSGSLRITINGEIKEKAGKIELMQNLPDDMIVKILSRLPDKKESAFL